MAERSAAETIGKLSLGIGAGFALYHLFQNLGFGAWFGQGTPAGEGRMVTPPSFPMDEQRLEFLMVGPTTPGDTNASLRGPGGAIYSLDEMIARIQAGGRADVFLKIRGDVLSGSVRDAESAIQNAGISIWKDAPLPKTVSGRGIYR